MRSRPKPAPLGILLLFTHAKSALMCSLSGAGGGGTGLELGDAFGGGEGGRWKDGHSGLGAEQFSHYTALSKGCHTKCASSCAFVFVGVLRTIRA